MKRILRTCGGSVAARSFVTRVATSSSLRTSPVTSSIVSSAASSSFKPTLVARPFATAAAHRATILSDDSDFSKFADKKILAYFTATWCPPCKMIKPTFYDLSNKFMNVTFVEIDVDKCGDTAATYNITNIPTFLILNNGKATESLVGADAAALQRLVENANKK